MRKQQVFVLFISLFSLFGILALGIHRFLGTFTGANDKPEQAPAIAAVANSGTEEPKSDNPVLADPPVQKPVDSNNTTNTTNDVDNNNTKTQTDTKTTITSQYPLHRQVTATIFWVGEDASGDNKYISNAPSAWDEDWLKHYGGVDDPDKRNGFFPANFTPKENPFYVALPYNDFNENGKLKKEIFQLASWTVRGKNDGIRQHSYCKNRWVMVTKDGKTVYAQWEDVGPFKEDDSLYVFGSLPPKSKTNDHAGLDVSPAVRDYLGLQDINKVDWQFVDDKMVPNGPWKQVITTSDIFWK